MVTLRYRTLVAFFAGVTFAIVAGFTFQAWRADAAPGDVDATFVPTEPCRVVDTRPAFNVGPRNTPLGAADTHDQQVTGTNGDCTIPVDAVGVSMNVTAAEPTAASFMTIFPSDATLPLASNINYLPGSPPTPNKVDVKLSTDGKVSFYNLTGTVHLVADVGGYYVSSSLVELAAQIAAAESRIGALETLTAELDAQQPVVWTDNNGSTTISDVDTTVVDVSLTAPADGNVTVISTTTVREPTAGQFVACTIDEAASFDVDFIQRWNSPGSDGRDSQLAGVRTYDVTAGQAVTYSLVCVNLTGGGASNVFDSTISAIFTPAA